MPRLTLLFVIFTLVMSVSAVPHRTVEAAMSRASRRPNASTIWTLVAETAGTEWSTEAVQVLSRIFNRHLGTSDNPRLPSQQLTALSATSDALLFLLLEQQAETPIKALRNRDFREWLLLNSARRKDFLNHFMLQYDRFVPVMDVLYTLFRHDGKDCLETWPLMLAMALVWDQPRPPLHDQIGPAELDFKPELPQRYDFFKRIYRQRKAAFPLSKLPIPALCFVVDTPVPVSELEWAENHVRTKSPQDLFNSIRYDYPRFQRAAPYLQVMSGHSSDMGKASLFWPYEDYSLTSILQHGGICTDQAYFTTLVLRARGIPAILLTGVGRRGGHAWVATMKSLKKWDCNVGRPSKDRYTTGIAYHPQTGTPFNDHLLPLICKKTMALDSKNADSKELTRLAFMLFHNGKTRAARKAAALAIEKDATDLQPWQLLFQAQTSETGRIKILERLSESFKDFPDLVTDFKIKQADLLRDKGKEKEALAIMKKLPQQTRRRDDLNQQIAMATVENALDDQDPKQARILLEKHLKNNRKEAAKLLNDINFYLDMTKRTHQTEEAVDFLESFLRTIRRSFNKLNENDPRFQHWDTRILLKAYENNGDQKKAKRLLRKMH